MRINVYNEDLLEDMVEPTKPKEANGVTFNGIQFFVGQRFEHTPGDDDSPAVIFWVGDDYRRKLLKTAFTKAVELLDAMRF